MMLLQFFIVLLIQIGCTGENGWLIGKQVKTNTSFKSFIAINNNTLVMQTKNGIYKANFQDPNTSIQPIVSSSIQSIVISKGNYNQSFLYSVSGYIHYEQADSIKLIEVKEIDSFSCLVRSEDLIFFYNPKISKNLLVYNMIFQKVSQGPYLMQAENPRNVAIEINSQLSHLVVNIESTIFFIDLKSMKLIKSFQIEIQANKLILMMSQKSKFVVQDAVNFKAVYMYDEKISNYVLIYQFIFDRTDSNKIGYTFYEQKNICFQIMIKKEHDQITKYTTEFDCSEPYDTLVDKQESGSHTLRYVGGQNKETMYSIQQDFKSAVFRKYQITQDGLALEQSHDIAIETTNFITKILAISKLNVLVLLNYKYKISILGSQSNEKICQQQIEQHPMFQSNVESAFFNPSQTELFVIFQDLQQILLWINLQTCQIKTTIYDEKILIIHFLNDMMYLEFVRQDENIYLLDPVSKEIQKKIILASSPNILLINQRRLYYSPLSYFLQDIQYFINKIINSLVFAGSLFGIHYQLMKISLIRYNAQFQKEKTIQINCQFYRAYLKVGTSHISAICSNQYHVFDCNLNYLGSTSVFSTQGVEETYSPFLKMHLNSGELHKNLLKKWTFFVELDGSIFTPDSDFYFYNESEAFSLGQDKKKYYLSHYNFTGKHLSLNIRVSLQLKVSEVFITSPNIRWSCNMKYILLKYYNILDKFNIYINVYQSFTFKLVYSRRLNVFQAENVVSENSFSAYLDCNDLLTISAISKLQVINIKKVRSILPYNFQDISAAALSSDQKKVAIIGVNSMKAVCIEVQSFDFGITVKYQDVPYDAGSKIFYINQQLYILSEKSLYLHIQTKPKKLLDQVSDCAYLPNNRLGCLAINNSLIVVNLSSFTQYPLSTRYEVYQNILVVQDILLLYSPQDLAIFRSTEPFLQLQSFNMQKYRIDLITLSPDSNKMITYDRIAKIFTYWNKSTCPILTQLTNGQCKCTEEINQGVCSCKQGSYESEGKCSQCSFYCKRCTKSEGNCQQLSAPGIIMIVGISIILVLAGFFICRYLRSRRTMVKQTQAMSELLEEKSSIND